MHTIIPLLLLLLRAVCVCVRAPYVSSTFCVLLFYGDTLLASVLVRAHNGSDDDGAHVPKRYINTNNNMVDAVTRSCNSSISKFSVFKVTQSNGWFQREQSVLLCLSFIAEATTKKKNHSVFFSFFLSFSQSDSLSPQR